MVLGEEPVQMPRLPVMVVVIDYVFDHELAGSTRHEEHTIG